jgi:ubiquinone biosynthesis protein COQ9
MADVKTMLIRAALQQVPHYGWTQDAITAATLSSPTSSTTITSNDVGHPSPPPPPSQQPQQHQQLHLSMSGMVSPIDLLHWFMDDMNHRLRIQQQQKFGQLQQPQPQKQPHVVLFELIQWRLQQVIPYIQCHRWHEGMALGLTTPYRTQSQLYDMITIVTTPPQLPPPSLSNNNNNTTNNTNTNDTTISTTNHSYQSAVGMIFVATELHLLTDTSTNYQDTWDFLHSRLDGLQHRPDDPTRLGLLYNNPLSSLVSTISPTVDMIQKVVASSSSSTTTTTMNSILMNSGMNSIPIMAASAVATSLLDGMTSLLVPNNNNKSNNNNVPTATGTGSTVYGTARRPTSNNSNSTTIPGTKASDYESPSSP